jgi:AbrB family looped-hinge helix DNA binding protein
VSIAEAGQVGEGGDVCSDGGGTLDGHLEVLAIDGQMCHLTGGKETRMSEVAVSKLTSKGQITIPEVVRRRLRLQAGEQLEWTVLDDGVVEVRKAGGTLEALTRVLPKPSRRRSLAELDQALLRAVTEQERAGR